MGSTTETSVRYLTDTRASQFTVQVFAGGLLSAFGHNPTIAIRDFLGDAQVNPDDLERSSLQVTVKAESLTVKDDI
jgi:polyisoprenoid-binding protein YceI